MSRLRVSGLLLLVSGLLAACAVPTEPTPPSGQPSLGVSAKTKVLRDSVKVMNSCDYIHPWFC